MVYYIQNETPRTEHSPSDLIKRYESGRLDGAALVAAKGDTGWHQLDSMLPLLRQDTAGPYQVWRPGQGTSEME